MVQSIVDRRPRNNWDGVEVARTSSGMARQRFQYFNLASPGCSCVVVLHDACAETSTSTPTPTSTRSPCIVVQRYDPPHASINPFWSLNAMSNTPATSVKARHYHHLAARMVALTSTVDTARTTLEESADQLVTMKDLATYQASMYVPSTLLCFCLLPTTLNADGLVGHGFPGLWLRLPRWTRWRHRQ